MRTTLAVWVFVGVALVGLDSALAEPAIECDPDALVVAITEANMQGSGQIRLAANCIYSITTPATGNEGLPVITGDIAIVGGKNTTIARAPQAQSTFRIITVDPTGKLTLRKLSIEGGNTPSLGGGILNNGTLELRAVTLRSNTAGNGGGLAVAAGATATVSKSALILNNTTGVGGGGFINSGVITVKKSMIANNFAPINGGGVNTQGSGETTVVDSTFQFNGSGSLGGALSNLGTTTVERCLITRNTGSAGGALATGNEQLTIERSAIVANTPDNCSPLNTIPGGVE